MSALAHDYQESAYPRVTTTTRTGRPNEGMFPRHLGPSARGEFHAGGALRSVERRPGWSSPDQVYVPPGWPEDVQPPDTPDWEKSAVAFLLDCCPSDYRAHAVLQRHPVVLARLAAEFVESQIRASREALGGARSGLGDYVSADVLDRTVDVVQSELARLTRVRRAVMLLEEALRGRVFIRRL